jgi:hypothetical protein
MDQRADHIRQNIESTRASLDTKLDTLELKARQTFDLNHQVSERPWMALGAAAVAGYVLGSLGSSEPEQRWHGQPAATTDYNQHAYAPDHQPHPAQTAGGSSRSGGDRFLAQFDDEIDLLKGAAITTLTNFLHDMIKEYVPALGQQLNQSQPNGSAPAPGASRYYDERPKTPATQADSQTLSELLSGTPAADTSRATSIHADRERNIGADTTRY